MIPAWNLQGVIPPIRPGLQGSDADRSPYKTPLHTCRIPDDCIDKNRYPLFMARAVLQELIESLQLTTGSAKP